MNGTDEQEQRLRVLNGSGGRVRHADRNEEDHRYPGGKQQRQVKTSRLLAFSDGKVLLITIAHHSRHGEP